ncbi:hypothetical protein BMJ20_33500 [Sinorhizobium medicae]|nr:hypothetical protein BMJ31_10070 [Sinorhizobium medicae]PLU35240.1 hypothetical protein BMJ28_16895 [Sinorhizobium medicae]PLU57383.1 hypothetical protein BMJ24_17390 [Sinorhizobium medicae]PLU65096.1 hypothetical protein BMJ20_33500 [Sinorhizobium medicae]
MSLGAWEMESNGYGSWRQRVIVSVDSRYSDEVARKLDTSEPLKKQGTPERAYFEWNRFTTKRGDDEDVVFEMSMLLGNPSGRYDWQIDWDASEF